MEPAWHGLSPRCLAIALCLAACAGCSAPSDYPALVCCTPETGQSPSQEDSQGLVTDPETAATADLSAGLPTPVLVFFTPETEPSLSQDVPQASVTAPEPEATGQAPGPVTPAQIFFTPTADQTNQPGYQVDAGTPGVAPGSGDGAFTPEVTRVALQLTLSATLMPRPTRLPVTPRATVKAHASSASDERPMAQWPKGWGVGVGGVLAIILIAWLVSRRRA